MSSKANTMDTKKPYIGCTNFQETKSGLICESCGNMLCADCIKELYLVIIGKSSTIHKVCDPFINSLKHYCQEGRQPANYIGNCCFIRNLREKEKKLEKGDGRN